MSEEAVNWARMRRENFSPKHKRCLKLLAESHRDGEALWVFCPVTGWDEQLPDGQLPPLPLESYQGIVVDWWDLTRSAQLTRQESREALSGLFIRGLLKRKRDYSDDDELELDRLQFAFDPLEGQFWATARGPDGRVGIVVEIAFDFFN